MYSKRLTQWILIADLIWVVFAAMLSYQARYGLGWAWENMAEVNAFLIVLLIAVVVWACLHQAIQLDGFAGGWRLSAMFSHVFLAVVLLLLLLSAFAYFLQHYFSRLLLIYFCFLLLVGFVAIRCSARAIIGARYRGRGLRKLVIVGNGRVAHHLAQRIARHPELLCEVVGILTPSGGPEPGLASTLHWSAEVRSVGVPELLAAKSVDQIIVVPPQSYAAETMKLLQHCKRNGINVSVVAPGAELQAFRTALMDLDGLPIISLHDWEASWLMERAKRLMDVTLGPMLAMFALPVVGVAAAVLLSRRIRPFRLETRCGRHGEPFSMLRLNVERDGGTTAFERFLDRRSITELPNLWNVLRGEMSLVGPRPESPERVRNYSEWQEQRLRLRPGITGLAQVHGLRDGHPAEEKAHYDLEYIAGWSLLSDLSLILQTVWTLLSRPRSRERAAEPNAVRFVLESKRRTHADRAQSSTD